MIRELNIVVLTHDMDEHGLKKGDMGAVALVHKDGDAFEVEFVSGDGRTIAVLTLDREDIRPMGSKEILHARELVSTSG